MGDNYLVDCMLLSHIFLYRRQHNSMQALDTLLRFVVF